MSSGSQKKPIPFEFVLDYLYPKEPVIKPMFGAYAVYVGGKIVLVLRQKKQHPRDNGVWIATTKEHHKSLRNIFPSMRSIGLLGNDVTGWQVLPVTADDFEGSVIKTCELIVRGDPRIGKVPQARSRKSKKQTKP